MRIGTVRPEEARIHDTWEGYRSFHAEETQEEHGSFEIFFNDASLPYGLRYEEGENWGEPMPSGWYWWARFPGCLPDSEPNGPFATSRQALEDADEWHPEFDE